jgi:hypothetical protein
VRALSRAQPELPMVASRTPLTAAA